MNRWKENYSYYKNRGNRINGCIIPLINPTYTCAELWAFKYNRAHATKPAITIIGGNKKNVPT